MIGRQIVFFVSISLLTGIFTAPAHAQQTDIDDIITQAQSDTSRHVHVQLEDGSEYEGYIIQADKFQIELKSPNGIFLLKRERIKDITFVDEGTRGGGWFQNPNATRLFFGSTGRPLEAGTGYYQNIYVFFSNIAIGASNGFSGSLGFSMIPGIGLDNQFFALSAKYGHTFNNSNHVALGSARCRAPFLMTFQRGPSSRTASIPTARPMPALLQAVDSVSLRAIPTGR